MHEPGREHLGSRLVEAFGGSEGEQAMSPLVRICIVAAFGIILLGVVIVAAL